MDHIVNILFSGDFSPCRDYENIVLEKKEKVFGQALPVIQDADLSFVNLECPLTKTNRSINKSGPALKADPKCASALKDFTVAGLANNHILDYGEQGLVDTIAACKAYGIPTVGAGPNIEEAQKVFVQCIKGIKVAIIAIAEHEFNQSEVGGAGSAPTDAIENYKQIQQAKSVSDIVIVTFHGGNEYFPFPRPGLRKLFHHFIDLGVSAVICHHPHVPGGYEYYNGKPIVYSLGNLVFDNSAPPKEWDLGYMAKLAFDLKTKEQVSLDLIPYRQSVELGGVVLLQGKEKEILLKQIEGYRKKIEDEDAWLTEWQNFVSKQSDIYILRQYFPFVIRGLGFLARNTALAKLFFNHKNSLAKLNILRCQSHKELLISALESKSKPRND
ncbi:MAG: CapA family protein [Actinobacteria bacterium]|nr:CapA family protein [Actinomycetota bacterium]